MKVTIKLVFDTPCLGNIRDSGKWTFERDSKGIPVFKRVAWDTVMRQAVRHMKGDTTMLSHVQDIFWAPQITCERVEPYKRRAGTTWKEHESFPTGSTIEVDARIPEGLDIETLQSLLQEVGTYIGMSPWGHDKGFGTFTVKEIVSSDASGGN